VPDSRTLNLAIELHLIALGLTTMPDPIALSLAATKTQKLLGLAGMAGPKVLGLLPSQIQYIWVWRLS